MKEFTITLKRISGFADSSKIILQLQPPEHIKLIQSIIYLEDGEGYHIADKRWKTVNVRSRCTYFRVQFTKVEKATLVGYCEVKYTDEYRNEQVKWYPVSVQVPVVPPFLLPDSSYRYVSCPDKKDPLSFSLRREKVVNEHANSDQDTYVSWIWLYGLPSIGKTILLRQFQCSKKTDSAVYWIDASGSWSDLPDYVAKSLGWDRFKSSYPLVKQPTGEDKLNCTLNEVMKKSEQDQQPVVIIFDALDKITPIQRFENVTRILVNFVEQCQRGGSFNQDTRWTIIFSHRLPSDSVGALPSIVPDKTIQPVLVGPWDIEEVKEYIRNQSSAPPRLIYEYDLDRLAQNLWRATAGHPILINAYLHSFSNLYHVYIKKDHPMSIQTTYRELLAERTIPDTIKDKAKELAGSFVSMLSSEKQELLHNDLWERHCSLDCLKGDQTRCNRSLPTKLEILKSVGIWRQDTQCPYGSPLLAIHLAGE